MINTKKPGNGVNNLLHIPYLKFDSNTGISNADSFFDSLTKQQLNNSDWVPLQKVPRVSFAIAHNNEAILLKFYIEEPYFRAEYTNTHDPVSNDSCVELFISFDNDANYYNLEFNARGTCLAAYGANRNNRERLPVALVNKITRWLKYPNAALTENTYQWEIALCIPIDTFCFSKLEKLAGIKASANFYKCGELLAEPHYLMWKPVATPTPDYHQPTSFGFLEFGL